MQTSTAFAPANISLFFTIEEDPDPAKMGSKGAGFTLDGGVCARAAVASADTTIYFNGECISFPTVESVIDQLHAPKISLELESNLPLGCGFGLSGASALVTAYAINDLCKLGKSRLELAKTAHMAEIVNKTGLGDVVNQYFGGFCIKWVRSSEFTVDHLPLGGKTIYYNIFSPLSTKKILTSSEKKGRITTAGNETLQRLKDMMKGNTPTLDDLFLLSKQFVMNAQLIEDPLVLQTIEAIEKVGGRATMILLGNGVVSTIPFQDSKPLLTI